MTLSTIHFDLDVLARSSIVHREDYSAVGTDNFTLFRREKIVTATGEVLQVPILSRQQFPWRSAPHRRGARAAAVLDYESAALRSLRRTYLPTAAGSPSPRGPSPTRKGAASRLCSAVWVFERSSFWSHHVGAASPLARCSRGRRTRPRPSRAPQSTALAAVLGVSREVVKSPPLRSPHYRRPTAMH